MDKKGIDPGTHHFENRSSIRMGHAAKETALTMQLIFYSFYEQMEIQECDCIVKVLIDLLPVFSSKWGYVLFRATSLRSRKDQYLFPADA